MPFDKHAALSAAKKYMLQNNAQAAIGVFIQIVESDPRDLASINTLGDLFARTGQVPEAVCQFTKLADAYLSEGITRKAIAVLKKIMSIDPGNTTTWIKLADLYATAGLPSEARQHYLQIADACSRNGQMSDALRVYCKVVDLDPTNASTRIKLGELYLREGMNEQAYDAFITAARQLAARGERRRALNAYEEALAIRPDSPDALTALRVLAEGDASSNKRSAAALGDSIGDSALASGNLDSPRTPEQPDRVDERETAFVIQEISKAEILVAYGQVDQAIVMLTEVARKLPDNVDVRVKLKDIYLRNGMTAEGADECRELERIYRALGDEARSRDYAIRASRLARLIGSPSGDLHEAKPEPPPGLMQTAPPATRDIDPRSSIRALAIPADQALQENPERDRAVVSVPPEKLPPVPAAPQPSSVILNLPVRPSPLQTVEPGLADVATTQLRQRAFEVSPASEEALVRVVAKLPAVPPPAKKRSRVIVFTFAASIVAVLGAGAVIGGFVFDARLNKQYDALSMSPPPPVSAPPAVVESPTEAEPLQAAEPITVVVTSADKSPAPSSQAQAREASEEDRPSPAADSGEPAKPSTKPTPKPSPPTTAPALDSHAGGNSAAPAGVPTDVPAAVPPSPPPNIPRVTEGVVMGTAVKRVEPLYPVSARDAGQSGTVRVEVNVDERGNVTEARVLSGPALLRSAAVSAARGWRFKPSTIGGSPVKMSTVIVFNFKL